MTKEIIAGVCGVSAEEVACKNCERFNSNGEVWCNLFDVKTEIDSYCACFDRGKNGKTNRRNIVGEADKK